MSTRVTDLADLGGEVAVPEQGQLLLERARGRRHAVEPPLDQSRPSAPSRPHSGRARLGGAGIGGFGREVEERVHDRREGPSRRRRRPRSRSPRSRLDGAGERRSRLAWTGWAPRRLVPLSELSTGLPAVLEPECAYTSDGLTSSRDRPEDSGSRRSRNTAAMIGAIPQIAMASPRSSIRSARNPRAEQPDRGPRDVTHQQERVGGAAHLGREELGVHGADRKRPGRRRR